MPRRLDLERRRLTQPLPPSPPLARIRNLSTIPRACTKPISKQTVGKRNRETDMEGGDLQRRRLSLPPLRRRPVVASQTVGRPGRGSLRHRSQRREPAEEGLLPPPHVHYTLLAQKRSRTFTLDLARRRVPATGLAGGGRETRRTRRWAPAQ